MLKSLTINRLLVLLVSFAFAFFAIDSLLEHWDILHKELWAYIPVGFGLLGALLGGYAFMKWNESAIRLFHMLLFVSFLVAAGGVYFHIKEEDDEEEATEQTVPEQTEKDKPPLAPLAFGGLAVVGLIGTSRKWEAEVVKK